VAVAAVAHAEPSRNVISAFKGQLVISKDEQPPEGKNDADTIKKIKAAALKELVGEPKGEITLWQFHYWAFLNQTGSSKLKLEFMNGKQLAADKQLDSVPPTSALLLGDITIDEDEGLAKGKTYTVQLVNSKDQVVSSTTLTMK
jgi:hypothetical protein